jgi:hypothetical protein
MPCPSVTKRPNDTTTPIRPAKTAATEPNTTSWKFIAPGLFSRGMCTAAGTETSALT